MLCVIKLFFAAFIVASSADFLTLRKGADDKKTTTIVTYAKQSEIEAYRVNAAAIAASAATGSAEIVLLNAPAYTDPTHASIAGGVSVTATCQTFKLRGTTISDTRCQYTTTFIADDAMKSSVTFIFKGNNVGGVPSPGQVFKYRSVAADGAFFGQTWDVTIEVHVASGDIKNTFTLVHD